VSYVLLWQPSECVHNNIIIIGLFNIAAKGWIEQYAICNKQNVIVMIVMLFSENKHDDDSL